VAIGGFPGAPAKNNKQSEVSPWRGSEDAAIKFGKKDDCGLSVD